MNSRNSKKLTQMEFREDPNPNQYLMLSYAAQLDRMEESQANHVKLEIAKLFYEATCYHLKEHQAQKQKDQTETYDIKPFIPENVKKVEIQLPISSRGKLAFALYNVFSEQECSSYIKLTEEEMVFNLAMVNAGNQRQLLLTHRRNSSRCVWDSPKEAERIFKRIKSRLPQRWYSRKLVGINERLRFLKYQPGQYFRPHPDTSYERENGEASCFTVLLYLNEGFQGGNTTFIDRGRKDHVHFIPKTGSVLIFQHDIRHEGALLEKGIKYCVRTDVMYSVEGPEKEDIDQEVD